MFKGSLPALVTPFTPDGELDLDTLKKLVEWHIEQGSHGLVPVGTTGESPTLTHDEHRLVIEEVVRAVDGRIPVIAGAGSNSTREGIGLVRHAAEVGADAALVVTPYYNKPTQAGLIAHYTALAEASDLPIIIYNIPGRSVVDMTQLSGEDGTALGFNAHGGVGCISVTANVAPRLCAEFQEATLAGDYAKALEYQDRLMPLHVAIFVEPGLVGAKYAMSRLGLCDERVRLPLVALTDPTRRLIDAALEHAGLI